MNERIQKLEKEAWEFVDKTWDWSNPDNPSQATLFKTKFAELIVQDMHRKVIASILITDVLMEEKGQVPTSEDYIRAINRDLGVEEK